MHSSFLFLFDSTVQNEIIILWRTNKGRLVSSMQSERVKQQWLYNNCSKTIDPINRWMNVQSEHTLERNKGNWMNENTCRWNTQCVHSMRDSIRFRPLPHYDNIEELGLDHLSKNQALHWLAHGGIDWLIHWGFGTIKSTVTDRALKALRSSTDTTWWTGASISDPNLWRNWCARRWDRTVHHWTLPCTPSSCPLAVSCRPTGTTPILRLRLPPTTTLRTDTSTATLTKPPTPGDLYCAAGRRWNVRSRRCGWRNWAALCRRAEYVVHRPIRAPLAGPASANWRKRRYPNGCTSTRRHFPDTAANLEHKKKKHHSVNNLFKFINRVCNGYLIRLSVGCGGRRRSRALCDRSGHLNRGHPELWHRWRWQLTAAWRETSGRRVASAPNRPACTRDALGHLRHHLSKIAK